MRLGMWLLLFPLIGACQSVDVNASIPAAPGRTTTLMNGGPELRTGVVTDFPIGMGYSHPRIGVGIAGDVFTNRFWLSGESRLLWAGKVDGGPGFSHTSEGTANLVAKRNFYVGGGALWTLTAVRDYSKSALHPMLQAAGRFGLGKNSNRLSLVFIRYTGTGTDKRNHYREIGAGIRIPFVRRLTFEQYFGVSQFHATDNPTDRRTGFVARWMLSYRLKSRND